ncbi:MAG TPA: glycosyltransferase family 39 protein [Thermoanaerobaculia bacterium]|nr:glycosyltransferase family 39 protein [Thermoanaerobaculia bacterium]
MIDHRQHTVSALGRAHWSPLRWSITAAAAGFALTIAAWAAMLAGVGAAITHPAGRIGVSVALAAAAATAIAWVRGAGARRSDERRTRLALAGALCVALCVRLIGIDHEVGERSYLDEGTYYRYATDINEGKLLPHSFVYPHLLYYVDAFALWAADRTPGDETLARLWSGTDEPLARQWLWLRLVAATMSAFTVLPVFGIGAVLAAEQRRVETGLAASAFYVLSPLFNEGSHLFISDFPSACLATVSLYFAARLTAAERFRDYALAGAFAGLAAATKYPAGTVALAIVVVWLLHRLRSRAWRLASLGGLATAAGGAIATFLGSMPAFFRSPVDAVTSPRGMLFGLRQYSEGGWIGVQPDSHTLYYLGLLAASFGVPALLLIVAAPLLARGERRRRLLWILPYPICYLALMISMSMVVKRNLATVIPVLAAVAGVGLVLALERIWSLRVSRPWRRLLSIASCVLALAVPAWATAADAVSHARESTREEAARLLEELLPIGATVLKESYTPRLDPSKLLIWNTRFYPRIPIDQVVDGSVDYLLLSSSAFGRFLREALLEAEHHDENARRYREVLEGWELVADVTPDRTQRGPALFLYRVPVRFPPVAALDLPAASAWVSAQDMRRSSESPVRFTAPGQWVVFRGHLAAGRYRVRLLERDAGVIDTDLIDTDRAPVFRAVAPDGRLVAELGRHAELALASDGPVLFQIRRTPGTEIDGLGVEPAEPQAAK